MKKMEFYENIEGILELEPGTIKGDEELATLGDWNSLSIISFIAFADGVLEISINPDELKKAKKINDLLGLVKEKIE